MVVDSLDILFSWTGKLWENDKYVIENILYNENKSMTQPPQILVKNGIPFAKWV